MDCMCMQFSGWNIHGAQQKGIVRIAIDRRANHIYIDYPGAHQILSFKTHYHITRTNIPKYYGTNLILAVLIIINISRSKYKVCMR